MHWRGTPGAKHGTPVLNSRRESQACMWRGTPGTGRGTLVQNSRKQDGGHKRGVARQVRRGTPDPSTTMGVPLEVEGVAR
ncbi:uncharacterized protein DS421_3g85910 [Arachis hypogaea]|nr:uncharacterized protein DS421_3g85910 [Arachis hypogaea]